MEPFVANMIITGSLGKMIDLELARKAFPQEKYPWFRYNTKRFSGAIIRYAKPLVTLLLFRSGKVVATGCKEEQDAEKTFEKLKTVLDSVGIHCCHIVNVKIQNVVLAGKFAFKINLPDLADSNKSMTDYNPEIFCGLRYLIGREKKSIVAMIFSSGCFNIIGAKSVEEARQYHDKTQEMLLPYRV